jgi:hypothetical protein
VDGEAPRIRVLNADGFPVALDRLAGPGCDGGRSASWVGAGFRPRWPEAVVEIWGGAGLVRGVEAERLEGGLPSDLRLESAPVGDTPAGSLDGSTADGSEPIEATHALARPVSGPAVLAVRLPVNFDERWNVSLRRAGRPAAAAGVERFVSDGYGNGWLVTLAHGQQVDAVTFSRDDRTLMRVLVALLVVAVPALLLVSAAAALTGRARGGR